MRSAEETVQAQVDAYNARDVEIFLVTYTTDAVLAELPEGKVIAAGRDAMRPIYARMFEATPELHCHIESRMVHGDFVVDHEAVSGFSGSDVHRAVAVYHVKEGLIDKVWFLKG